jgi:hypothetical protein
MGPHVPGWPWHESSVGPQTAAAPLHGRLLDLSSQCPPRPKPDQGACPPPGRGLDRDKGAGMRLLVIGEATPALRRPWRLRFGFLGRGHRGVADAFPNFSICGLPYYLTVDRLSDLDLSYTPPFGSPWDAVQLAAQDWVWQTQTLSGPLLLFELAEDRLDGLLAQRVQGLAVIGVAERCRRCRRRSPLGRRPGGRWRRRWRPRRECRTRGRPGRHGRPGCPRR